MTKKFFLPAALAALALPLIHPFGPVRQQSPPAALGARPDNPLALPPIQKACRNCHSEGTRWPLYSYLPLVSWAVENDVAEARKHINFSRWDRYSPEQKRDLLARIGTAVRNRRMPLPRYLLLHPEARLTDAEIQVIYQWTKARRRATADTGE